MNSSSSSAFKRSRSAILGGLVHVDDRGDGFADIVWIGRAESASQEVHRSVDDAAALAVTPSAPDSEAPRGTHARGHIVGHVIADDERMQTLQDAQGNWVCLISGFPGTVVVPGLAVARVSSKEELANFLGSHLPLAEPSFGGGLKTWAAVLDLDVRVQSRTAGDSASPMRCGR